MQPAPPVSTSTAGSSAARKATLVLFASTLFLSAALLFAVEPMIAKMLLPQFGGSAAVWSVCLVFFQACLLSGYGYAHLAVRLSQRRQIRVHAAVCALAVLALPLSLTAAGTPPAVGSPVSWLFGALISSVGPIFFVLSSTTPLLQAWFARTNSTSARDPFFLYAASNAGSLIALLGYPFVIEPAAPLPKQALIWSAGVVLLLLAVAGCARLSWLHNGAISKPQSLPPRASVRISDRLSWVLLAAIPSSLLLGVTTYVATDLLSAPLVWVVPLALYLLSFVIVFARRPLLSQRQMLALQPFLLVPVALLYGADTAWLAPLHFAAFFVTAMVCHGELALRRPSPEHLTDYYLWISLGGAIGGVFNTLLAPLVFKMPVEYAAALCLACFLRPRALAFSRREIGLAAVPAAIIILAAVGQAYLANGKLGTPVFLVLAAGALVASRRSPLAFGGAMICVLAAVLSFGDSRVLLRDRSFFGVHKISLTADGTRYLLTHGSTIHGAAWTERARADEPIYYYHRSAPLGQFFALLPEDRARRVGVIGLGTGALSCYAAPGSKWTFFELDPVVERLAHDTRFFRFLADCAPHARIILGDGRVSLQREPDQSFDVLVVDAFSSDSIPAHLLTQEALAVYRRKVAPEGIILFHISNRHLDLRPVVDAVAAHAGLAARERHSGDTSTGGALSQVVAVARQEDMPAVLQQWQDQAGETGPLWTDAYSSILSVLRR